ncbi:hypothetical protein [Geodermatophilus maliterrae]|uniref:Uncharacterized protein n=1 Tax=Geodermatophilus maliterrae TaxID=3162531 RepID=A0ABV3XGC9_9ACTN
MSSSADVAGLEVTRELLERLTDEEMEAVAESRGDARALSTEQALADEHSDSLTLPAHERTP